MLTKGPAKNRPVPVVGQMIDTGLMAVSDVRAVRVRKKVPEGG